MPGTHSNATDVVTETPWTPYSFTFDFSYNLVGIPTISSASVGFQVANLARRSTGSGFGFADVSADGNPLGDLLSITTNLTPGDPEQEEIVRSLVFDVTLFVVPNSLDTL